MVTSDLNRCLLASGCIASLYLPTPSRETGSAHDAAVRWQNLRRELGAAGVDEATLEAMDGAVGVDTEAVDGEVSAALDNRRNASEPDDAADHSEGDVLAVIATGGDVLLRRALPSVSGAGRACAGPVAWLTPLLEAGQHEVAYVVVLLDRRGADVWGTDSGGDTVEEQLEGSTRALRRVHAGGWSQRRFQQRAVNSWESNAAEVATEVEAIAAQAGAERVLVAGEEHAVAAFLAATSAALRPLVRQLSAGSRHSSTDTGDVAEEVRRLVQTVHAEETVALLEQFREQCGQGGRAANGPEDVVLALQMGIVDVLLVHDDPDDTRRAWYADDAGQVALDLEALRAMGSEEGREARLIDVCVRAALLQGGRVRIVPGAVVDGALGALLRAPLGGAPTG